MLLDACRDNPYARKTRRVSRAEVVGPALPGIGKVEPTRSDTLIAYAARAGSTSEEGDGDHSPYTAALLRSIAVPGLDIRLAMGRVRAEVMKLTAGRQEPFVDGSMAAGAFPLVPASAPPLSGDSDQAIDDSNLVKRLGTRKAFEVFLSTYGPGLYADLARAELDKLETGQPAGRQ